MYEPSPFFSLLPFLLVSLVFFLFAIPMSRRQGKSIGYAVLCLMPFLSILVLLYLVSLTDKAVMDRLATLEGKTG